MSCFANKSALKIGANSTSLVWLGVGVDLPSTDGLPEMDSFDRLDGRCQSRETYSFAFRYGIDGWYCGIRVVVVVFEDIPNRLCIRE